MKKSNNQIFTCSGINNSIAILRSEYCIIENIFLLKDGRGQKNKEIISYLNNQSVKILNKNKYYQKFPDGRTQGIVIQFSGEIIKDKIPNYSDKKNICFLALDRIEDPQNFGQIIRTAECGGIDGIIFSKHYTAPINETVLQISQGAFTNVSLYEVTNLIQAFDQLKKDDFWIIGVENNVKAKPWYSIEYLEKKVIVLGSEGKGIREKILKTCDFLSTIPMQGITNSLNVSAAVAAIAFERLRQKLGEQ